MITRQRK